MNTNSRKNRTNQKNFTNAEFLNCPLTNPTEAKVKELKAVKKTFGTINISVVKKIQSKEMKNNNGVLLKDSIVSDLQRCLSKNIKT